MKIIEKKAVLDGAVHCEWKFLPFTNEDQRKIMTSKKVGYNLLYDTENEANNKEKQFTALQRVYTKQRNK